MCCECSAIRPDVRGRLMAFEERSYRRKLKCDLQLQDLWESRMNPPSSEIFWRIVSEPTPLLRANQESKSAAGAVRLLCKSDLIAVEFTRKNSSQEFMFAFR